MKKIIRQKLLFTAVVFVVVVGCCSLLFSALCTFTQPSEEPRKQPRRAAIIDQLSDSQPNQTFLQTATATLEDAGFSVDYFSSENVTVEFLKSLPSRGYDLLILRQHSGLFLSKHPPLALFTSEPYSKTKYIHEQLTQQVVYVFYEENEAGPHYFGVLPKFVRLGMAGRFPSTVVVLMGCDGLTYPNMPKAFVEKGAAVCVGWNGPVSAEHTDRATLRLLRELTNCNSTVAEGVAATRNEVGPDAVYKSTLSFYPAEAGNYTLPS